MSAVNEWSAAGIPKDQIVLGVPSYGRSFNVSNENAFPNGTSTLALFPAFDKDSQPLGDSWDSPNITTDACGNESGPSGVFEFRGLIEVCLFSNYRGKRRQWHSYIRCIVF